MVGEDDKLERAYEAIDAALQESGSARHLMMDEALKLWRLARGSDAGPNASGPPTNPARS